MDLADSSQAQPVGRVSVGLLGLWHRLEKHHPVARAHCAAEVDEFRFLGQFLEARFATVILTELESRGDRRRQVWQGVVVVVKLLVFEMWRVVLCKLHIFGQFQRGLERLVPGMVGDALL